MVPQTILLEFPDDIKTLALTLESFNFKPSFIEGLLENVVQCLRDRSDAYSKLDEYVENVRGKEGEYVARYVDKIGRNIYHQLLDIKAYFSNGKLPYVYGEFQTDVYLSLELHWGS